MNSLREFIDQHWPFGQKRDEKGPSDQPALTAEDAEKRGVATCTLAQFDPGDSRSVAGVSEGNPLRRDAPDLAIDVSGDGVAATLDVERAPPRDRSPGSPDRDIANHSDDPLARNVGGRVGLSREPVPSIPSQGEEPLPASASMWTIPKVGHVAEQNEDDVRVVLDPERTVLRAIVADGASSSWHAREWATTLTDHFADLETVAPFEWTEERDWDHGLRVCRERWQARLPKVEHRLAYLNDLAEDKRKRGAGACLLVLECDLVARTWRAVGYGNCLLVHANETSGRMSRPFTTPDQFNAFTPLVSSVETLIGRIDDVMRDSGTLSPGDEFFLASDETAKWGLSDPGMKRFDLLRDVRSDSDAALFVNTLRASDAVQDDDMSAIHIRIGVPVR